MLLAIDVGNTNIHMGIFDGESLRATWRMASDSQRMSDEYAGLLMPLFAARGLSLKDITEVVLVSSVPPLVTTLSELSRAYIGLDPLVIGAGIKTNMRILYDSPRDVGPDRIADAVAAYRLYGGPVIVVDLGTATVFDAISKEGDYLGGAIAPGIGIAADALFQRTSLLRRIELVAPKEAIGRNTTNAVQSGLVYGYVGLIEGVVARFQRELGGGARVVATGGQARVIAKEAPSVDVIEPNLTLMGLRILHELNK